MAHTLVCFFVSNDTGSLNAKVLPWTLCRLVLPSSIIMSVQRTCKPLGVDAEDDQSEQENCVLQDLLMYLHVKNSPMIGWVLDVN